MMTMVSRRFLKTIVEGEPFGIFLWDFLKTVQIIKKKLFAYLHHIRQTNSEREREWCIFHFLCGSCSFSHNNTSPKKSICNFKVAYIINNTESQACLSLKPLLNTKNTFVFAKSTTKFNSKFKIDVLFSENWPRLEYGQCLWLLATIRSS